MRRIEMIFEIARTSDPLEANEKKPPCSGAKLYSYRKEHLIPIKDENNKRIYQQEWRDHKCWTIEFKTLEALLLFKTQIKSELIIEDSDVPACLYKITIYDAWVE